MATNTTSRFIAKNGLDNNSNSILNVLDPVNAQDGCTANYVSSASNLNTGLISGINGSSSLVNIQHYTTSSPVASSLSSGQIAIDATNGYMWFMSNGTGTPVLKQLVTLSSNYAQTASQTATYRQTVLSGPVSQNSNRPNFLSYNTSSGVVSLVNLTNTIPLVLTISNGFGASTDSIVGITSTGATNLTILADNVGQKQYIYYDYSLGYSNNFAGFSNTPIPPTYGTRYSVNSQSRLMLTGSGSDTFQSNLGSNDLGMLRDYYGNQWYSPYGNGISTTLTDGGFATQRSALFNVYSEGLGQSVIDCNDINNLGIGPWSVGCYVKFNATLPTSNYLSLIAGTNTSYVSSGFGNELALTFGAASTQPNAGTAQLTGWLSSNGTSWDIASAVSGASFTIPLNTWIYVTQTFTGSAYYMGYAIPGVQNNITWSLIATSSLTICPIRHMNIGNTFLTGGGTTVPPFQISDFAFQQYSTYITGANDFYGNGSSSSAGNIEGDYFNIPSMTMYSLTGNGSNLISGNVASMTTSVISTPVANNFVGGERVLFYVNRLNDFSITTSTVPALNTTYFVVNPTTYTFQIATTASGFGVQVDTSAPSTIVTTLSGTPNSLFYLASSILEKQIFNPKVTYNASENLLSTGCIPHGLSLGDNVSLPSYFNGFAYVTPTYAVVPVSDNKFRLSASIGLSLNTPALGTAYTTANPITSLPNNPNSIQSCAFGNSVFVNISSTTNAYLYSTDGIVWTSSTLPSSLTWSLCIWDGSQFVAIGVNQSTKGVYVSSSTNGISGWTTPVLIQTQASLSVASSLVYGNGIYLYTDSSGTFYSTNLSSWTASTVNSAFTIAGGVFGYHASTSTFIFRTKTGATYYSVSGATWTTGTVLATNYYSPIIYGNGVSIIAANQTSANTGAATTTGYYSTNGQTWTAMTLTSDRWMGGYYDATIGQYVLIGQSNIAYSATGIGTWTAVAQTQSYVNYAYNVYPVQGNGLVFVAGNSTGSLSPFVSYTQNQNSQKLGVNLSISSNNVQSLTYGKGTYISTVTSAGSINRSYDGLTWAAVVPSTYTTNYFTAVAYGAGTFVALSTGTTSLTGTSTLAVRSTDDGTTWTAAGVLPTATTWNGIAYGNGIFIAYNSSTTIAATSVNISLATSVAWTPCTLPAALTNIAYVAGIPANNTSPSATNYAGYFIGTLNSTTAYISVDAINWTAITLSVAGSFISGGNGIAIIASGSSVISSPLPTNGLVSANWVWTTSTPSVNTVKWLGYKNGLFTLVSTKGDIAYSNDGSTWSSTSTLPSVLTTGVMIGATMGNGNVCVIGQSNVNTNQYTSWVIPIVSDVVITSDTFYNNLSLVSATPANNLTQQTRVYIGEYANNTVTPYAYRGEYVSDWFPVTISTNYSVTHNIGTAAVYTAIFFNKTKSDNTTFEVTSAGYFGSLSTSGQGYSEYGACVFNTNRNTINVVTGSSSGSFLDTQNNLYPAFGLFNQSTSGYYKIKMERNW